MARVTTDLSNSISELYADAASLRPGDTEAERLVIEAIDLLDRGAERVAEVDPVTGEVVVHQWLKRGYQEAGVRVVPGASARWGSYLAPGVVLMPSYVNIGARVGERSMVDTWATVGSCAQIGSDVHLAGGVGIGGVLEPPNASPVLIEDEAFIGSRCMVVEGARVGRGAVLGAGTILNPSIPVIDAKTGVEVSRGVVPAWSVAVGASRRREFSGGEFFLPCVLILETLTEGERHDKAQLNDVLRDHGVAT